MKNTIIIVILFILTFSISCNNTEENDIPIVVTEKPIFNTVSYSRLDSVFLSDVLNIWYWKIDSSRISIFSPRGEKQFLSVYSVPDFNLLYQYGEIGQGPEEYITVNWGNSSMENQIILYDMMKRNLYSFVVDHEQIRKKDTFTLYGEKDFNTYAKPFTMIHQVNDSIYLLKAEMSDNSYLELVDLKNRQFFFSQKSFLKRNPSKSYTAYNYEMEYIDSLIITAYNYIDRIEFISLNKDMQIDNMLIVGDSKLEDEDAHFNDLNNYYTDIKSDGEYIYAVSQNGKNDFECSSIEIYDRSGTPVMKMDLDQYVELILISKTSGIIYAYNSMKEDSIIYIYENPVMQ